LFLLPPRPTPDCFCSPHNTQPHSQLATSSLALLPAAAGRLALDWPLVEHQAGPSDCRSGGRGRRCRHSRGARLAHGEDGRDPCAPTSLPRRPARLAVDRGADVRFTRVADIPLPFCLVALVPSPARPDWTPSAVLLCRFRNRHSRACLCDRGLSRLRLCSHPPPPVLSPLPPRPSAHCAQSRSPLPPVASLLQSLPSLTGERGSWQLSQPGAARSKLQWKCDVLTCKEWLASADRQGRLSRPYG